MNISILLSAIIPPIMMIIYFYAPEPSQTIIAFIGSIATGALLSIVYRLKYED